MSDLTPASIDIPEVAPKSAEERKQIAQVLSQRCIQVLKQEFGATEVIVYGSLRGDSPWHDESDVDLAVSGLASKEIWDASIQLGEIMPEWLPFDLVRLETIDARVGRRILQTAPFPEDKYLSLKLHLEDKIAVIESSADKISKTLAQIDTVSASLLTPILARYLEGFYGRCEKLAKRVAVGLDGGTVPKGSNWHEQLLLQMSEPGGQGRRPLLWERSLFLKLDEYRRFHHQDCHLYSFDLDEEKVLALAQQVPSTLESIQKAVNIFGDWLEQQADPARL